MKTILSLTSLFVMRDMLRYFPNSVRIWLVVMMSALFVAPMFFLEHAAAQWMAAMFMLGGVIMGWMHMKMGITKLMGIAHLPWLIPLFLIFRDISMPVAGQSYQIWLLTAASLATICLLIDVVDVIQYATGKNRTQLAPPAPA
jgi:hypothetical protein